MSIAVMNLVWNIRELSAGQKLVALALADSANEQGVCWPSITTIARKSSMSTRTARRHIGWLEGRSLLRREGRCGRSNIYTVTPAQFVTPDKSDKGDNTGSTTPDKNDTPPLSKLSPRIIMEPPTESSVPSGFARKENGRVRKAPATPLPDGFGISDSVRAWAISQGFDREYVEKQYEYFIGQARAKGYTYVDWDQALINCIRGNWAKAVAAKDRMRVAL